LRRFMKRTVVVHVSSEEEMVDLIERLTERIKYVDLKIESGHRHLRITLYGTRDLIKAAIAEIYEINRAIKGYRRPDTLGMYSYPMVEIMRLIGGGTAIPMNLIVEALKFRGRKALVDRGAIRTDASLDEVAEVARMISWAYSTMKYMDLTPMSKRIVALLVASVGIGVDEAIHALEEAKLIRKIGDNPYTLSVNFEEALRRLKEVVRRLELETEGDKERA